MCIKCIAIGNRIMGDDAIGIKVVEEILPLIKQQNIEVIISETDVNYALEKIEPEDFLLIIDSTYYDILPGSITATPIKELLKKQMDTHSQHQPNLIHALHNLKYSLEGYLVGIEVEHIGYSFELSKSLKSKFTQICTQVYEVIKIMHDTYLLNKISQSLQLICEENKIKQVKEFNLVVNLNSHINEENLAKHLAINNKQLIAENLQINIKKDDIDVETAIIHSLQGELIE